MHAALPDVQRCCCTVQTVQPAWSQAYMHLLRWHKTGLCLIVGQQRPQNGIPSLQAHADAPMPALGAHMVKKGPGESGGPMAASPAGDLSAILLRSHDSCAAFWKLAESHEHTVQYSRPAQFNVTVWLSILVKADVTSTDSSEEGCRAVKLPLQTPLQQPSHSKSSRPRLR